jgi:hypothetical protein
MSRDNPGEEFLQGILKGFVMLFGAFGWFFMIMWCGEMWGSLGASGAAFGPVALARIGTWAYTRYISDD